MPADTVEEVAKALRSGERAALLMGGSSLRADGLHAASRVAATTGAALLGETFPANLERGAGIPAVERLAYLAEMAQAQLDGMRHLVLVDAKSPVSFFAYPGKASDLVPAGCTVHTLARPGEDAASALEALAEAVGAAADGAVPAPPGRPGRPTGGLSAESLAAAVGATLPEGTIVVDEGNTSGLFIAGATAGAPRHDWLTLTGGAIGIGLPLATGAAVAAPERPVLCVEADGSAMYTLQALWTQAREGLNVTTIVLSNRSYAILNLELHRVGADAGGPMARRLLDLTDPELDFCDLARGMGVPAQGWRTPRTWWPRSMRAWAGPGRRSSRCPCRSASRTPGTKHNGRTTDCAIGRQQVGLAPPIGSNGSIAPPRHPVTIQFGRAMRSAGCSDEDGSGGHRCRSRWASHSTTLAQLRRRSIASVATSSTRRPSPANEGGPEPIDYASLEFEVERMRKRLAIWEIFMGYMRQGAHSWPEVQRSLTKEDFDKIVAICDGVPLRDLLLDMR